MISSLLFKRIQKHYMKTNFPDSAYLEMLVHETKIQFEKSHSTLEKLLTYSSAQMNWIADYILDPGVTWSEKQEVAIADLWLTGTNPEWNAIIIDKAERSPTKLHQIFESDPQTLALFENLVFDITPILVRKEDSKLKVLDGMHRVVAAIKENHSHIQAYIATPGDIPQPQCEPHVVYDLIRAYHRDPTNKEGLVAALRYLRHAYTNVDVLLQQRFSSTWIQDQDTHKVIEEALQDEKLTPENQPARP
jgi:hypothetical protein